MLRMAFSVPTDANTPLDAGSNPAQGGNEKSVSNFLTVQSLTNFAAMTGAISAAWHGLIAIDDVWNTNLVPYGLAVFWGLISFGLSWEALAVQKKLGAIGAALFVAFLNSMVLGSAVVGADSAAAKQKANVTSTR